MNIIMKSSMEKKIKQNSYYRFSGNDSKCINCMNYDFIDNLDVCRLHNGKIIIDNIEENYYVKINKNYICDNFKLKGE